MLCLNHSINVCTLKQRCELLALSTEPIEPGRHISKVQTPYFQFFLDTGMVFCVSANFYCLPSSFWQRCSDESENSCSVFAACPGEPFPELCVWVNPLDLPLCCRDFLGGVAPERRLAGCAGKVREALGTIRPLKLWVLGTLVHIFIVRSFTIC